MGISLGSVRAKARQVAQDYAPAGATRVESLLAADDYTLAVAIALRQFSADVPNLRVVDATIATASFRQVLAGTGALAALTSPDAWSPAQSELRRLWCPFDATVQGLDENDPNSYRILPAPGKLIVLELLDRTPAVGDVLRLEFTRPHALTEAPDNVAAPVAAPTVALAGDGAGVITAGTHVYAYAYRTAEGRTTVSDRSVPLSVATPGSDGQANITVAASGDYGTTAIDIYRTEADDDAGDLKYVGSIDPDVTVFRDNVADGSLGEAAPTTNTAGGSNSVADDDEPALVLLAASEMLTMAANRAVRNTGNTNLPGDVVDRRSQSDQYRSRARELRERYQGLVGGGGDGLRPASAIVDLDVEPSAPVAGGFLWHDRARR